MTHFFNKSLVVLLLLAGFVSCGKKEEKTGEAAPSAVTESGSSSAGVVVNSQEGKFSLILPSGFTNPAAEMVPVATDVGPLTMTTYLSESPRGLVMFSFLDYPASVFETRSVAQMLDGGREGALQSMNATLEKQEDFTFEGNQGRSIYFNLDDQGEKAYGRIDYLVVKPRLYQLGYLSHDQAEMAKPDVAGYFKSFQLVK